MSLDSFFATLTSTHAVIADSNDSSLYAGNTVDFDKSSNYQWDGPKLTAQVGNVVPLVYGRHRVAGEVINAYLETSESNTLNMLICLCEGEVSGVSNVKVGGVPVEELYGIDVDDPYGENVEITVRKGTENQTVIKEFGDVHSPIDLNVTLIQNEEYIYTTDGDDIMSFSVGFKTDKLYQLDSNNNKSSWYFAFKIDYRKVGDTNWIDAGVVEFNAMTETEIRRIFKSDYVLPAQYEIKFVKASEDANDENKFGQVTIYTIDEIVNLELTYPFMTMLGLRLIATDKIKDTMPDVTAEVEGKLVSIPDVRYIGQPIDWEDYYYDAESLQFKRLDNDAVCTWDGVTYIEAFSANPVWCIRDLYLNERYGLGQYISASNLDSSSFLSSALYCETGVENAYGKLEKRVRLDIVLDQSYNATDIISQMAATFRGSITTTNGVVRIVIERESEVEQVFGVTNIIAGSFSVRYHSPKEVPNVLVLEYTNKDKDYARDKIEIADSDTFLANLESVRTENVSFFGCTRPTQCLREGKILLNKLKLNTRDVSFTTATEGLTCQAGSVIRVQHDVPQWAYSGRVQADSTSTVIKLSKLITLEPAKTYEILIRDNDTDTLESKIILTTSGTWDEVEVSEAFSFTPTDYDVFLIGEQDLLGMTYRITGMSHSSNGQTSISAVQYSEDAYDSGTIVIPDSNFTYIDLDIPDVYSLKCTEQVTRENDGTIRDTVLITFVKPPNSLRWIKKAVKFHVYYSDNSGVTWIYGGATDGEQFVINTPLAIGTSYIIAVVSEADSGEKNAPQTSPQDTVTIQGWMNPASTVTGFYYNFTDTIEFYWDKNQDPDHFGYEIRTEDADWGQDDSELIWRGNAEKFILDKPSARQGVNYFIKAYNTSLKYSVDAAEVSPINLAPSAPSLSRTLLFQKVFLFWSNVSDDDIQYYEIWRNDNDDWVGIEQGNETKVGDSAGTSSVQILEFETTYFRIRAIDSFGPGAWSNSTSVDRVLLASDDLADEIIGAQHLAANSVTAGAILAGSIQTAHLAAKSVLAENIDVAELSAMSAHLGTIESGTIIGNTIKTSLDDYRLEINAAGLFAYDNDGNLRTKLTRGQLCLIDPNDSEYYSYLDSGALKFHHPYGTTPYVKRVKSGEATTGDTVYLAQWYEQPELTLSIKKLSSYKSSNSESDQEWSVFSDNLRYYDNGGGDFGWAFDVHSKLVISGGTKPECIWLCNFDQTVETSANVNSVLVRSMFQLWTHSTAPANYCYGVECYEIRYKVTGAGVWCSCCYSYTQPHSSIGYMSCTQTMCNLLTLPSADTWDISVHRVSLNWYDSGISSGVTCCCWCCYQYSVDCSYYYWKYYSATQCQLFGSSLSRIMFLHGAGCCVRTVTFPGAPSGEVYYSALRYKVSSAWGYTDYQGTKSGAYGLNFSCEVNGNLENWSVSNQDKSSYGTSYVPSVSFCVCVNSGYPDNTRAVLCIGNVCQLICYRQYCKCCLLCCVWCCYQYEIYLGSPATCTYEKLYSTQDTTDEECVLDGAGTVNYLAVSYA